MSQDAGRDNIAAQKAISVIPPKRTCFGDSELTATPELDKVYMGSVQRIKVINIDPSGKVRLSRKVLLKDGEGTSPKYPGAGEAYNSSNPGGGDDDRRGGGDRDRGPRR